MRLPAAWACVAFASAVVAAQDAGPLEALVGAYRAGAVADRMSIEAPQPGAPAAVGTMTVAVRTGAAPAVSLSMGEGNPLRVVAEPGRLIAWRAGDTSRVFVAPLPEPFGRAAMETVLPTLPAPQIDLAFAGEPGPMLAFMPELSWSLVASGERDRYAGVAPGAALELTAGAGGRLVAMEARREGRVVARAEIEAVGVDAGWFEAPSLDATVVATLADLGEAPGPVRVGERFGDAIGVDARGRVATLRGVAGEGDRIAVLAVSARWPEARSRLAGELAEARLASLAAQLDARLVLLVEGDASAARLLERVTRTSRADADRVRAIAVERAPAWVGEIGQGVAYSVDGAAWTLLATRRVAPADEDAETLPGGLEASPFPSSRAPRSWADRLGEAVGGALRGSAQ